MRVDHIEFSAGAAAGEPALSLAPTAVTVFIGPNNGGKSTALREIHDGMFNPRSSEKRVIKEARIEPISHEQLVEKFNSLLMAPSTASDTATVNIGGRGRSNQVDAQHFKAALLDWHYARSQLLVFFALNLNGESRLQLANGASNQRLTDKAMSTIAEVFKNDAVRAKLSGIVHDAFGAYLAVDATSMSNLQYALSQEKPTPAVERSFDDAALRFFAKTSPLQTASDGTRAFIGVISEVFAGNADIMFIDEPEAFLHPGLAYELGRQIGLNTREGKQVFAATHSPQFLMGCLSAGIDVNIVRLADNAGSKTAHLLDSATLATMMADPLLRSSNVIAGLFYNSVVVVEGDSDRAFYEEINIRLAQAEQPNIKHPLFINAHSKQTAPDIVRALRNAGVPAAMILDIDWLKEDGQVQTRYFAGAGLPAMSRPGVANQRGQVRRALEAANADYKRQGGIDVLQGDEKVGASDFFDQMDQYGLFTVRSGELESWLPELNVGRNKTGWLERIFNAMGRTRAAPDYVTPAENGVWAFLSNVAKWTENRDRKGMKG